MWLLNRYTFKHLCSQIIRDFEKKNFCDLKAARVVEGAKAALKKRFTADEVECFCHVTGDLNAVHFDDAFAARLGFDGRLVPGALLNSLVAQVFGTQLPGSGAIVIKQTLYYRNPLYIGEEVTVEVTLCQIKKIFLECEYKCEVSETKKVVMEGDAILAYKVNDNSTTKS